MATQAVRIEAIAALKDELTPVLGKIDRELKDTTARGDASFRRMAGGIAAASAIAAGAAVLVGKELFDLGSAAAEVDNVTGLAFGSMKQDAKDWATSFADSTGSSRFESEELVADLGLMVRGMGFTSQASLDMSSRMVELAADMSSAKNVPLDVALEKIRSGLVGQSEPLRTMGVLLSAARVKEEAYATGIAERGAELTEAQKVEARMNIILADSVAMHGDLVNTQDSAANMWRAIQNKVSDAATALGVALLPAMTSVLGVVKDWVTRGAEWIDWLTESESRMDTLGAVLAGVVVTGLGLTAAAVWALLPAITAVTGGVNLIIPALTLLAGVAVGAWVQWGDEIKGFLSGVWNSFVGVMETAVDWLGPLARKLGVELPENLDNLRIATGEVEEVFQLTSAEAAAMGPHLQEVETRTEELVVDEKAAAQAAKDAEKAHAEFFAELTRGAHEAVPNTSIQLDILGNTITRVNAESGADAAARFWAAYNAGFVTDATQFQGTVVPDIVGGITELPEWPQGGTESAGHFSKAFSSYGGWKGMFSGITGAVSAFATGGWKGGLSAIANEAMQFLPPGMAQVGQAALAAFGAVWKAIKRPSEEELAARESFAGIHASAVEHFGQTADYQERVAVAIADNWDRTLAETRIGFDMAAEAAGRSAAEGERLYARYQEAVKSGNTEVVASIEATYQSWIDEAAAAEAATTAAWERSSSAAVSAFDRSKTAGIRAYDETLAAAIESGLGEEAATAKALAAQLAAVDAALRAEGEKFARVAAFDAAMALGAEATQAERRAAAEAAALAASESWGAAMEAVEASDQAASEVMHETWDPEAGAVITDVRATEAEMEAEFAAMAAEATTQAGAIQASIDAIQSREVDVHVRHHTTYSSSGSSGEGGGDGGEGPPRRAHGGPVAAGVGYLINERGTETFVPNVNGTVIPHGGGSGGGIDYDRLAQAIRQAGPAVLEADGVAIATVAMRNSARAGRRMGVTRR